MDTLDLSLITPIFSCFFLSLLHDFYFRFPLQFKWRKETCKKICLPCCIHCVQHYLFVSIITFGIATCTFTLFTGQPLSKKLYLSTFNTLPLQCSSCKIRTSYKEDTRMGHIQRERLPKSKMVSSDNRFTLEIMHVLHFGNELNKELCWRFIFTNLQQSLDL